MGTPVQGSINLAVDELTKLLAAGDHEAIHKFMRPYILWCCKRKAVRHRRMTYEEVHSDIVFLLESSIEYARTLPYGALYLLKILSRSAMWWERDPMHQLQDVPVNMPPDLPLTEIIKLEQFEYTIVEELIAGYSQRDIAAKYHIDTNDVCRRVALIRVKVKKWQKQNS